MTDDDQVFHDLRAAVQKLHASVNAEWLEPGNKTVEAAIEDAKLIAEFVVGYVLKDGVGTVIGKRIRSHPGFEESLGAIRESFEEFRSCLLAVGKAGPEQKAKMLDRLDEQARKLRTAAESTVDLFAAVLDDPAVRDGEETENRAGAKAGVAEIRRQLQARWLLDEAVHARDETLHARDESLHARDVAREAAGHAGAAGIEGLYKDHADAEARKADRLRVAVVALLTTVAVVFVVLNFLSEEFTVGSELLRLSATVPLAALAGYLMRESAKHRASAQWAGELAIAMQSLPAYTQPLGAEGLELHRALGMRAFAMTSNRAAADGTGLYDDLMTAVDAVAKVEKLLQRARDERRQPEVDS